MERVQKNAFRSILQERYKGYKHALHILQLNTLHDRRKKLLLNFGKKCLNLQQTKETKVQTKVHNTKSTY